MKVKIKLDYLLIKKEMSRQMLASKTGINLSDIKMLCNNVATRIRFEHIEKIAKVLDCGVDDILVLEDDNPN